MNITRIYCSGCKHNKKWFTTASPNGYAWYCDLKKCERENKEGDADGRSEDLRE